MSNIVDFDARRKERDQIACPCCGGPIEARWFLPPLQEVGRYRMHISIRCLAGCLDD